jgi:hypothetical protein
MINIEGYRLSNMHLRLGSKVHITDFIYGKKLLQNGFYAKRFAFLCARNIYKACLLKKVPIKKIVLIGYGYNSEVLVSNVSNYLSEMFKGNLVDNCILDNENILDFSDYIYEEYNVDIIQKKETIIYIPVLPIGCTLSTVIRIEDEFRKQLRRYLGNIDYDVVEKSIRFDVVAAQVMIIVGDAKVIDGELNDIVSQYWQEVDLEKKIIKIKNNVFVGDRYAEYCFFLKTKWYYALECPMCYPENILEEMPIYYADKASITPLVKTMLPKWRDNIFSNKVCFKFDESICINGDDIAIINGSMVKYIHYAERGKHYYYYINEGLFFKLNRVGIYGWAKKIKITINDVYRLRNDSNVLLISTEAAFNGGFLKVINEVVFNNNANIIKINPYSEDFEDIKYFMGGYVGLCEKIFFIDNMIATGSTLQAFNRVIGYVSGYEKKIDAVFTLIERVDYVDYANILEGVGHGKNILYSFLTLCFPIIHVTGERDCYLCERYNKYLKLSRTSSLGSTEKYYYDNDVVKLEKKVYKNIEPNKKNKLGEGEDYNSRRLYRLMLSHYLYIMFSDENDCSDGEKRSGKCYFNEKFNLDKFVDYIKKRFLSDYYKSEESGQLTLFNNAKQLYDFDYVELKITMVKVLSEPPFSYYIKIKESIFKEIVKELERQLSIIVAAFEQKENTINSIQIIDYIRVLIKQASILSSNYILSELFIKKIIKLIDYVENRSFVKDESDRAKRSASLTFFCVAAIKDSMVDNEQKTIYLERNIEKIRGCLFSLIEGVNNKSCQFLDMLMIENTGAIMSALKFVNNYIFEDCTCMIMKGYNDIISENEMRGISERLHSKIKERYVEASPIKNLSKFENLSDDVSKLFLSLAISYSYIKAKCEGESLDYEIRLKNLLIFLSDVIGIDIENGGAFILYEYLYKDEDKVRESKEKDFENTAMIACVGDVNSIECAESISAAPKSIAKMMLKGMYFDAIDDSLEYHWTVRSLRVEEKKIQIYNDYDDIDISDCQELIQNEYNRFYYYRIADVDAKKDRGVIVFYDKKRSVFDLKSTRYILTIRRSIIEYFKELNNDAFIAEIQKKKRAVMYLSAFKKFNHGASQNYQVIMGDIDSVYQECKESCGLRDGMLRSLVNMHEIGSKILISRIFNNYMNKDGVDILDKKDEIERVNVSCKVFDEMFRRVLSCMVEKSLPINITYSSDVDGAVRCSVYVFRSFIIEIIKNAIEKAYPENVWILFEEKCIRIKNDICLDEENMRDFKIKYKKYLLDLSKEENITHAGLVSIKIYLKEVYGMELILPEEGLIENCFEVMIKYN